MRIRAPVGSLVLIAALVGACGDNDGSSTDASGSTTSPATSTGSDTTGEPSGCRISTGPGTDYASALGCVDDFELLASLPPDASIAGARSIKTLVDRSDDDALYFTNSRCYPLHWGFAQLFLSGNGLPPVADLSVFNTTEYYSPNRRFLLGTLTHYAGADVYAYEISPYDTASVAMIEQAYRQIRDASWFGDALRFHPSSSAIEALVPQLGDDVVVVSTEELFAGVAYQPYNVGETFGRLGFYAAVDVATTPIPFRDIAVLDTAPLDISVTAGIITSEFQTPLSHINVLSVNRGTPNMALRGASEDAELRALEGKPVRLVVEPFGFTVEEVTQAEADAWWEQHRPEPLDVPAVDMDTTALTPIEDVIADDAALASAIAEGIPRFGAKATNYAAVFDIDRERVPIQDAFAIPFYFYERFMADNGFDAELAALEADPQWDDPMWRRTQLQGFQETVRAGAVDPALIDDIVALFATQHPGQTRIRLRSSTNAEDLGSFTGAGLYDSNTGHSDRPLGSDGAVDSALKETWASLWNFRAYEERSYYSIDHHACAMAVLATPSFPDEEANGVAITNNIFDTSGGEPAFYVNVQVGENAVVHPDPGVLPDAYLHYFFYPGQPVTYLTHSTLISAGETVLDATQVNDLGVALAAIHAKFLPVCARSGAWYGMDVEFKFDDKNDPGGPPTLFVKQARPYPWDPGSAGGGGGSGECDGP